MLSIFDELRGMDFFSILLRMLLSCLCGAVIGLERSYKNRPAGFRTHILVCMGSAAAALTGLYLFLVLQLPSDISRISGQVISGLGFIGAGTIIVTKKLTIKGLTTAAGLWTAGIIGLAIGSGYYEIGLMGTVLVLLAETLFASFGKHIQRNPAYEVEVLYNEKTSLDQVLRLCKDNHMAITNLKIHTLDEGSEAQYIAEVALRGGMGSEQLLSHIRTMPGIIMATGL
ncbi:MAG: MgtC/SapB family protein [Clostridia bacterium]|nr:MgtC/SapB family protein [Clostridia bacterium]